MLFHHGDKKQSIQSNEGKTVRALCTSSISPFLRLKIPFLSQILQSPDFPTLFQPNLIFFLLNC